jgi:hypothetical protein
MDGRQGPTAAGRAGAGGPRGSLPCYPLSVRCALIISLIIQTILLDPSGAVWTDDVGNVSRLDPSGAIQVDTEHPARNRTVPR